MSSEFYFSHWISENVRLGIITKVTSYSVVAFLLLTARRKIVKFLVNASRGDKSDGIFIKLDLVSFWEPIFYDLWNTYLDMFLHDELLVSSTLLDARNFGGRELSPSLLNEAKTALETKMRSKFSTVHHASDPDHVSSEKIGKMFLQHELLLSIRIFYLILQ